MYNENIRKLSCMVLVIGTLLELTGCGALSRAEDFTGTNNQIKKTYVENAGQTDTEDSIRNAASEAQESGNEEGWEDTALLEEYAAYGIVKIEDFYYYRGELVYIIKDQHADSSVYLLNTDSKGTVSIKVTRNAEEEIAGISYMTEEEVEKARSKIWGEVEIVNAARFGNPKEVLDNSVFTSDDNRRYIERYTKTGNQEKVSCFFAPIFGIFKNRQYYAVQRGIERISLSRLANPQAVRGGRAKRNFHKFPPISACAVL